MTPEPDTLLPPDGQPRSLRNIAWPAASTVLVLAPHPDDFDAISLTLRHLHAQGHVLHVAVLTTGASGVDDGFEGASDDAAKAALRETEQRESCACFGLPSQRLHFLRLWGDAAAADDDRARLRDWMAARPADLLFMPHGNDSNATHRRTCETVCSIAAELRLRACALLNQDAKTLRMRVDLYYEFGEQEAAWKAQLLRRHRSQQARNLRTRGSGFDERVLGVNGQAARALGIAMPWAETFELAHIGGAPEGAA